MRRLLLAAPLLSLLAGCAGGPPHGGPSGGGPRGDPGARVRPRLFVSPAGEPFRPGPAGGDGLAMWFARADGSGDGRLDAEEFAADALRFFAVVDADANGVIAGVETTRYEAQIVPEITGQIMAADGPPGGNQGGAPRGGRRGAPGGPGGGGGFGGGVLMGAAPYGITGDPEPIRAADLDLSQTVSKSEFEAHARRQFQRLDTDKNGRLTMAEATLQKVKPIRPSRGPGPGGGQGPGESGRPPGGGRR